MSKVHREDLALHSLDALMSCWEYWDKYESFYLQVLAPSIVAGEAQQLNKRERILVDELKELLSGEEWTHLPTLMRMRREGELVELESDAARNEVIRERERLEAERLAEVERRETERLAREAETRAVREREEAERRAEVQRAERERLAREAEVLAERRRRAEALRERIRAACKSDFLTARAQYVADPDRQLVSGDEFEQMRLAFVREWAHQALDLTLDDEQAAAIAQVDGNVQVVARAGSGKTRTLVTRALFLQKHCGVPPQSLLLVAFNRRAAEEMRSRLAAALDGTLPHVMTFHALAYALVRPEEELVFDDRDADQLGLSREVQDVIDEHVRSEEHGPIIRELMLAHFREDWEHIVRGGFDLSMEDFLAKRRALTSESLAGEYVKSFGEKLIANALFEHDIAYKYERNFRWGGHNYRPDFTIGTGPQSGVVIEYFGLKGDPDYDDQAASKRAFWASRSGWTLIEMTPADIREQGPVAVVASLLRRLAELGVQQRHLEEEEIWSRVRGRAIDRFTDAMTGQVPGGGVGDGVRVSLGACSS